MEEATASTAAQMEAALKSKQTIAKGKRNMEETTASTVAQEASPKLNQEVGEPSQNEYDGKETASTSMQEGKVSKSLQEMGESLRKVLEADDMDTDTDTDEDEEAVTARWSNGLAAKLGNGGVILVLVETNTGFAIFMYDGIKLLKKDALQNIWVDFADHAVAKRTAWLLDFRAFDPKDSAIDSNGISKELAIMIRKHIEPGQKLAVENEVYQKIIQTTMEISCLCSEAVEELMWGLKVQMPYLVPQEESMLDEKDCFPMSKGMKQLLNSHSFILEPEDMKVPRNIIKLAGVVRECDRCVNKHDYSLRSDAEHLERISHIDTKEWDLMKLATALKMICYPEEKIAAAPLLFSKRILAKLKKDAPKYEDKISKKPLLIIYKEMYLARRTRSNALRKLSRFLEQREKIQEALVQLTECNESLLSECNKRQKPPTLVPADALLRYTCISSHQLHRTNEPGILSMHIHPSKDIVATGGIDTNAVLFDLPSRQILCTLTGHSKKITTLNFVNGEGLFITGSADKTVRIWHESNYGNYSCGHIIKDHTAEVAAVTVQAGEKYFVSASKDNSWCLYDISAASCVLKVGEASEHGGYTSALFHPRGLLLGTGTTTAAVKLWDMKTKSHVANLKGHAGPVTAISFSENGYLLATAALDGVKLWDVRKLEIVSTISPYHSATPTNAVEFDSSGSYLGIGGSDARVYQADKAECDIIKILPDLPGTGKVTSLKFGADTKYIAVGSTDNLWIFGLREDEQMEV